MFHFYKNLSAVLLLVILFMITSTAGQCNWNEMLGGGKVASADVVSQMPYELVGRNILVKVKVNHSLKDYTFLVDTGASTVINQKIADELGLQNANSSGINTVDAANITKNVKVVQLKSLRNH